jgi:hypothetical protein
MILVSSSLALLVSPSLMILVSPLLALLVSSSLALLVSPSLVILVRFSVTLLAGSYCCSFLPVPLHTSPEIAIANRNAVERVGEALIFEGIERIVGSEHLTLS